MYAITTDALMFKILMCFLFLKSNSYLTVYFNFLLNFHQYSFRFDNTAVIISISHLIYCIGGTLKLKYFTCAFNTISIAHEFKLEFFPLAIYLLFFGC